ncbi:MAG TPA: diacylglycerol kinase [Ornithinibacter sp.]|jgi:diacylglycerol kinase (ATP)|uniref:diacylglycerol kinase n=1 Tax=Ornithinibacter sp. TaxID=2862748 RepID=UPI001B6C1188|nr:diacylglycerol kinase [Ornithinibacter sp.]MBP6523937.1 diacylglycerol kinase [Dermatophilaceae bacterium]MBU9943496.1 diacylglycerol kinase [Dermatophilaceae bacterium]HQV82719.1 diacylglycerol kinase [Ornithinibacter sp.]HQW72574.1 diacylglycerol kinase [Ornithinibacter sp.]HQX86278.1 diacylglycerol kinase [Ornithinibacter sp.]
MARLGLMVNPTSGKNTGAQVGQQALSLLRDAGVDVLDLSASDARSAVEQGRAAIESGAIDRLVVGGGDGMVHLGANLCAGTPVPLGVIAAGTGNDIARELGLPVRDAAASVQRILSGSTRQVDAARHTTATGGQKWFLGVLAAGFDAVVNERANQLTWPKGPMRYNLAILRELPVFRAIPYTLVLDGERIDTEAMLVAVGNGPAYGGGMRVTPDASFDDGLLDVLILRKISTFEFLRVFPRVFKGTHVSHHAVQIRRARTVSLEAKGIVSYADGERFAPLPMSMEVVPGALTVLA